MKDGMVEITAELYQALASLFHVVETIRTEQVSDSIFGGPETERRRANSEIYAHYIRSEASKIDGLLGDIGRHFGHDT